MKDDKSNITRARKLLEEYFKNRDNKKLPVVEDAIEIFCVEFKIPDNEIEKYLLENDERVFKFHEVCQDIGCSYFLRDNAND